MAGMYERAARAAYGRIEQHWPDVFDECQSQDTDCCQGEDCAEDIAAAVLAVAADMDEIAAVLTRVHGCRRSALDNTSAFTICYVCDTQAWAIRAHLLGQP